MFTPTGGRCILMRPPLITIHESTAGFETVRVSWWRRERETGEMCVCGGGGDWVFIASSLLLISPRADGRRV